MSWVERTTVISNRFLRAEMRFSIFSVEAGSRLAVGSSRRRISGFVEIAEQLPPAASLP